MTTLAYDSLGRISQRYAVQGYSDYTYDGDTDWLLRETWHAATSGNTFDLVRYWYANGRPSRVEAANVSSDLQTLNGYTTYYLNVLAGSAQSLANQDDPRHTWVKNNYKGVDERLPLY